MLLKTQFKSYRVGISKERILTNYSHLAELLNIQSKTSEHAYQLLTWLKKQLPNHDAQREEEQETENEQRLESDEDLVKIVTLHGSKGLEYPIVFIPFAGFPKTVRGESHMKKYYDDNEQTTVVKLGRGAKLKQIASIQEEQEQMRLLYVGITRAVHRCYLGIGKPSIFTKTPLCKLIEHQGNTQSDKRLMMHTMALKEPTLFEINSFANDIELLVAHNETTTQTLNTSQFSSNTDQVWQLASFSQIAKQDQNKHQYSHIDLTKKDRDQIAINHANSQQEQSLAYRYTIEKSADTGTLLHNLLEDHEFTSVVELDEKNAHIQSYCSANRDCNIRLLQEFITEILNTPIPNIYKQSSFKLSHLSKNRVLKEPEFYFPIEHLNASDLNHLLGAHRTLEHSMRGNKLTSLTYTEPLVANIHVNELNGMMHGFIDLLFEYDGKYYVADYKSNFLGASPSEYLGVALSHAVQSHLYDLQYLIYSWALDRYLSKRLANYSRSKHFGGVYYLFLRGMSPSFPPGTGVYFTKIDETIWTLLDGLLTSEPDTGGVI